MLFGRGRLQFIPKSHGEHGVLFGARKRRGQVGGNRCRGSGGGVWDRGRGVIGEFELSAAVREEDEEADDAEVAQ